MNIPYNVSYFFYKWAFVLFLFVGPIVQVAVSILVDICIHLSWWLSRDVIVVIGYKCLTFVKN